MIADSNAVEQGPPRAMRFSVDDKGHKTGTVAIQASHLDEHGWISNKNIQEYCENAFAQLFEDRKVWRHCESHQLSLNMGVGDQLSIRIDPLVDGDSQRILRAEIYRHDRHNNPACENRIGELSYSYLLSDTQLTELQPMTDNGVDGTADIAAKSSISRLSDKNGPTVGDLRRNQLFHAACDVISKGGYAATTIRKIASAAQMPIATMYQYIDTKEDILYMITSECMANNFEYFQANLQQSGTAEEKLSKAIGHYLSYVSENRKYINLVYRETASLSKNNREKIFDIERDFTQLWQKIIDEGKDNGEFSDIDSHLTANFFYFFCNIWALRFWSIDNYSEEQVRQVLTHFFLKGLKEEL